VAEALLLCAVGAVVGLLVARFVLAQTWTMIEGQTGPLPSGSTRRRRRRCGMPLGGRCSRRRSPASFPRTISRRAATSTPTGHDQAGVPAAGTYPLHPRRE
jgi:hypothetical protein